MKHRKFFMVITAIVSTFLFICGFSIMLYMNNESVSAAEIETEIEDAGNLTTIFKKFSNTKQPFNTLILGEDKVNKNSDTMMVANYDPNTYKINIMSIPRDTKVTIDGRNRKINFAYPHGGIDLAVDTVSELLDIDIKYYVFLDTTAFREIIDILDGVELYIPPGMDYDDPIQKLHIHLESGMQVLDGKKAEQFVRFRQPNSWRRAPAELKKYYDGSDLKRIEAQQRFLKALIDQKLNIQNLPKLNPIIEVVFENIETNYTTNDLLKLSGAVSKLNTENVAFHSLPGSPINTSPWYFVCDTYATKELVSKYFSTYASLAGSSETESTEVASSDKMKEHLK